MKCSVYLVVAAAAVLLEPIPLAAQSNTPGVIVLQPASPQTVVQFPGVEAVLTGRVRPQKDCTYGGAKYSHGSTLSMPSGMGGTVVKECCVDDTWEEESCDP
jgi:hypothetical protein